MHSEADDEADRGHQQHHKDVARKVGCRTSSQDRWTRHGQRTETFKEAGVEVGGQADCRADRSKDNHLREDTRHEVVYVANARYRDGAAEDVPEHQYEDHRLDRREHKQLWHSLIAEEVAPSHSEYV